MLVPPLRPPVGWAWDPGVGLSSAEAARRLGDTARTGLPRRARTAMAGLPPPVPEPVDPDPAGCGRGQPGGDPLVTTATVRRDSRTVRVDAAELVPGDVVMVEARDRIPADGRRFLGPRWSCRNPRTPAKRSRSASPPPRAGQRAAYSLTEPAIQLVPVFAQLGSWGLRHRPTSRALRVRAELLEQGGPASGKSSWTSFAAPTLAPNSPIEDVLLLTGPARSRAIRDSDQRSAAPVPSTADGQDRRSR